MVPGVGAVLVGMLMRKSGEDGRGGVRRWMNMPIDMPARQSRALRRRAQRGGIVTGFQDGGNSIEKRSRRVESSSTRTTSSFCGTSRGELISIVAWAAVPSMTRVTLIFDNQQLEFV